jgi:hypothetical protein
MKPKRELSLDGTASSTTNTPTADELRTIFARVNPHVPIQAYDDLLSQYTPTPLPSVDESAKVRTERCSWRPWRSKLSAGLPPHWAHALPPSGPNGPHQLALLTCFLVI